MARINEVYDSDAIGRCDGYEEYVDSFGNIVEKDSPRKNFGFSKRILEMDCLDMDKIEIAQKGSNEMTMDLLVEISTFDDIRQCSSAMCLLPVELKLNAESFNLGQRDLLGKDEHTRQYVLGVGFAMSSVFLFPDTVVSYAMNSINRWKRGTGGNRMAN